MSEQLDLYISAKKSVDDCETAAERLVANFNQTLDPLKDWKLCELSSNAFFNHKPEYKIHTAELPTVQQLTDAINSWHCAKKIAALALTNVPQEERKLLR